MGRNWLGECETDYGNPPVTILLVVVMSSQPNPSQRRAMSCGKPVTDARITDCPVDFAGLWNRSIRAIVADNMKWQVQLLRRPEAIPVAMGILVPQPNAVEAAMVSGDPLWNSWPSLRSAGGGLGQQATPSRCRRPERASGLLFVGGLVGFGPRKEPVAEPDEG